MKKYILIAGVNGAGKSTLYQSTPRLKDMPRVNTDEILKDFGDWKNPQDLFKAGKMAVSRISDYFSKGITFNQETTLCGKAILKNIKKAKELGYFVELHYVGVDNVDIAKERVRHRVQQGGHGIPEADIERRYIETFQQINLIIEECDLIAFYDNTQSFRRFAIYKNGKIAKLSKNVPIWFEREIKENHRKI